jgi:hypothetical protein
MLTEPIRVTLLVVEVLNSLNIPYFIGGSLATAVHGVARATMDVDIVAELRAEHAQPLVDALGPDFYADAEMMRDAVRGRSSFNVIHKPTMFKVDVFIPKGGPFDWSQFERRIPQSLTEDETERVYIASPEDNILAKLRWYRLGGEVSDRQWRDVLNVIRIQGARLDRSYLRGWAHELGVAGLLEEALSQSDSESAGR